MGGHSADLRLDDAMLRRRLHFLRERARAHDTLIATAPSGKRVNLHRACAATLRRDAAAVALLLGDIRKAKAELMAAGEDWLRLGLFYGAFLLRLGDNGAPSAQDMTGWIEEAVRDSDGRERGEGAARPFANQAARNPRQLLSVIQAGIGIDTTFGSAQGIVREHLAAYKGLPLGATGVTLGRYIGLLDALRHGDLGSRGRETLTGLAIRRRELVEAAQQDAFHWRRLHQPAELVDFDLLALGLAARAGGPNVTKEALGIMGERGAAASLPFELARELGANGMHSDEQD